MPESSRHANPGLPVDASDQHSNVGHEQSPTETPEVPPQLRIQFISGILRSIGLLLFSRPSGVAAVAVYEIQDDYTASHHVGDLGRHTSDEETATRIEKSHVGAIACRRDTGDGASSHLNKNARKVCADEDVRIPLRLEFGMLLATVEDDMLEHDGDGGGDERRPNEETSELHGHSCRAFDECVSRPFDYNTCIYLLPRIVVHQESASVA